ncbi:hypothetical protein WSM22_03150 [Cytophagales bacterium WSM2-2]|nr:hypothetical protein WSM22_03150 [Cytophagales bacterium WSM2-2]
MPALNFISKFKKAILNGDKPGTIRQQRKNPIKPGDTLYLFTGMRSAKCKKFDTKLCLKVYPIEVDFKNRQIIIDGIKLGPVSRESFATIDICGTENEFFKFFAYQNYQRPTVWIVWDKSTVEAADKYLIEKKQLINAN